MPFIDLLTFVLIISFLIYGGRCLFAEAMVHDFKRWDLPHLRYVTGLLEVLGALGLVVGRWFPWVGIFSAAGLALLMVCGIIARARIKDTFLDMLPALILLIVNLFICLGPR
jgi:uncharacterized membrane protein YphA (DoxX/SURF4 family)